MNDYLNEKAYDFNLKILVNNSFIKYKSQNTEYTSNHSENFLNNELQRQNTTPKKYELSEGDPIKKIPRTRICKFIL